uniref:Uncharacterized protein n=1 Tax=Glossina palpalis gambiensis TaxID=67801 RepID=A0A1B0B9B6_9MUSC
MASKQLIILTVLGVMACLQCEAATRFDLKQAPKKDQFAFHADQYLKNQCVKNLGNTIGISAYRNIEKESEKLKTCLNGYLNFTKLQTELSNGDSRNNLKPVFSEYCRKKVDLTKCIENFSKELTPCLDKNDRELQKDSMRMIGKLFQFLCLNNGNQIALFITNGGPECVERHYKDIDKCIKPHIKEFDRPPFTIKKCKNVNDMEKCILNKLNTCPNKTAANIVQGLFRHMKKDTMCRN